jgi:hypothetical protein
MKLSTRLEQIKRQKQAKQPRPTRPQPVRRAWPKVTRRQWALAALWLLLLGGGAWAALEFVVWNKLPPELVGRWQVREGPMAGGVFDFSSRGNLEIHVLNQGRLTPLSKARVAVNDKTLLTTTYNPRSQQEETKQSAIRELTANSLILELESGEVLKMTRSK